MPSDHGFGLNDYETGLPLGPNSEKGNPKRAIKRGVPATSAFVAVDRELLTKGKLDDCLLTLTAEQGRYRGDDDRRIAEVGSNHVAILKECSPEVQTDSQAHFQVA